MLLLSIDSLKELMETLDLGIRNLLNISGVTENLGKEVLPFLIIKQEVFLLCVTIFPVMIDPFKEEILIRAEIRLMNKDLP
jgi:hypothetical protein